MAAVRGTESVDMDSFQQLAPETWLNDQVMNYVAKQVIQPATRNTFCYSSFFFTRLLHNTSRIEEYDFTQVNNCHSSRGIRAIGAREIFSLQNLFVPINKDNSHWLLLQASFTDQKVYLYDSDDAQTDNSNSNGQYLDAMVRYFYDVERTMGRTTACVDGYAQTWSRINRSGSTPKQTNSYDCGVFTLINLALLVRGQRP